MTSTMIICKSCTELIPSTVKFCGICGTNTESQTIVQNVIHQEKRN